MSNFDSQPYIQFPVIRSFDELVANALDALVLAFPTWLPVESNLEVQLVEVLARMQSETALVAANVPAGIFRYFGKSLLGIPAIDAASATVPTTWTLSDNLGHTITAGTQVGYRVDGDTLIGFQVQTDVVVDPGNTTTSAGEVILVAQNPGITANDLVADTMYLVDSLAWVSTVTSTATSSGGVDAETDADYLDRLRAELQLLSPRPILPNDFAVLAQRIAGVGRATAIDGYDIGLNEIQRIAITGSPTGGDFTLTYSGQTTGAIAWNANAATVQSALEALSNIALGDVAATGGVLPATPVLIEFTGTLATTDVAAMTSTDSLTGGTSPATVLTTPTPGEVPSSNNERTITVAVASETGTALSAPVKAAVDEYLQSLREINFIVYVIDPTYTAVNVTTTVKRFADADAATVEQACEDALTTYLSPASWDWAGTVYYNELVALLSNVTGVDRVVSLTVPSGDLALTGVASLPTVGALSVAVVS